MGVPSSLLVISTDGSHRSAARVLVWFDVNARGVSLGGGMETQGLPNWSWQKSSQRNEGRNRC